MDFTSRGSKDDSSVPAKKDRKFFTELRAMTVVMILLASTLMLALAALFAFYKGKSENTYIDNSKFQTVFLSDGSAYFGRIRSLNDRYLRLDSVFYMPDGAQLQPDEKPLEDVNVTKLGCERHKPTDLMIINRQQVLFWENLSNDSPVLEAIAQYIKDNPSGCAA